MRILLLPFSSSPLIIPNVSETHTHTKGFSFGNEIRNWRFNVGNTTQRYQFANRPFRFSCLKHIPNTSTGHAFRKQDSKLVVHTLGNAKWGCHLQNHQFRPYASTGSEPQDSTLDPKHLPRQKRGIRFIRKIRNWLLPL